MNRPFRRPATRPTAPLCAVALGLAGCASLDPADDLGAAQDLVSQRVGVDVDWGGPWSPSERPSWPPVQPLAADDAARLALHNHAGMRASVESIVQARAAYVAANLLPNPVVNATLGFPIDGGPGNPIMSSLLLPLTALWQRPARIDVAQSRLRAAVLAVSDAALTLVASARLAHARLVFAERDLGLETEARDLAAESLALVDARLAEGEATGLERNRVALEVFAADARVTDARARRDAAQRALLELCGVVDRFDDLLVDGVPVPVPDWIDRLSESDLVSFAEQQRLDLAVVRVLEEVADDEVRLAELRRLRTVSLGAGYIRNHSSRESVGPSLQLELPLFDDGRAEVAKAESLARTAAAEAERTRQAALGEVRRAWVELRRVRENLDRLRVAVLALAAENRRLAEQSFAVGVVDRGTVLDLARRELRVRLDASRVELAAVESFIELERVAGGRVVAPEELE